MENLENDKQSSIALILPYFGKLPDFFKIWLESCKANPTITWIVFTDDKNAKSSCENVKIIQTTFDEIRSRAQACFDFPICLNHPYKLCDFRPVYGLMFADYLKNFDFWGYCDCDLVWGNFRKFITESILQKHDRILANGHLSLFRNNAEVNNFFKNADYKRAFTSELPFAFDEWGGTAGTWNTMRRERFFIGRENRFFDDINQAKWHFCANLKPNRKNCCYVWHAGTLKSVFDNGNEETLYAHFQKRKMNLAISVPAETGAKNGFVFVPNKVLEYDKRFETDKLFRKKYCRERLIYWDYIFRRCGNAKKKLKRFFKQFI